MLFRLEIVAHREIFAFELLGFILGRAAYWKGLEEQGNAYAPAPLGSGQMRCAIGMGGRTP